MSGLSTRLATLAPEQLSQMLVRAQKQGKARAIATRHDAGASAAVSYAQRRLWFAWQLQPESPLYNIAAAVRLTGRLEPELLAGALDNVVRRHEVLRTVYSAEGSEPVQRVVPELRLCLPVREVTPSEALRIAGEEAQRPFDLNGGPVLRALLLRTAPESHVLVLSVHHIAADGWSIRVLVHELSALYAAAASGRPASLPGLEIQYSDYAEWERGSIGGERLKNGLAFWRAALLGAPALLEFPTDRPRPPVMSHRGARFRFPLPASLLERAGHLAKEENATLFIVLIGGFHALLDRYTGQGDIAIGTPVANRLRPETEPLIGLFANTVVIRAGFQGAPSFREVVRRARKAALDAYAHQDVPFELVAAELEPGGDLSHNPIFQAAFVFEESPLGGLNLGEVRAELLDLDPGTAKFDLTLTITVSLPQPEAVFEYSTDLFDSAAIERMAGHFRTLLEGMLEAPDAPVAGLFLLPQAEREMVLRHWNATDVAIPHGRTFDGLFTAQAARTPDTVAVVAGGDALTYAELNARANRLGRYLQRLGVGPEVPVALSMERSVDLIVAVLGILKAGGAYVPLDPALPPERLAYMLADSHAPVLVTRGGAAILAPGLRVVSLTADGDDIARESDEDCCNGVTEANLAYVIYTSGSTGRPKGVLIEHRSAVNLAEALERDVYRRHFQGSLRASLNAPLSFDVSVQGLSALLFGHTAYLIPEDVRLDANNLLDYIRGNRLHVLDCVPSQLKLLLSCGLFDGSGWIPPLVMPAGEAIDEQTWNALAEADTESYNAYGPTECTVYSTLGRVRETPARPSIGRPIANARAYVLDSYLQPVPPGVPGELYIGGVGVARGYLNRPELTATRFVPDLFGETPGARIYRTGDLVRWMPDGSLDFLGRTDRQVKLRGFRIELGEIECALRHAPGVREAVVIARGDVLAAYVVPVEGCEKERQADLSRTMREALKAELPLYMVPAAFVLLDALPLTPAGKVDHAALPLPDDADRAASGGYEPPRDALERRLADIWADLLGAGRVGIKDNFFEIGGDSIRAAVFTNRVQKELGAEIRVERIFRASTIAEYATLLRRDHPGAAARLERAGTANEAGESFPLAPAARTGDLPLSPAQDGLWVAEQLGGGPLYNISAALRLRGDLNAEALAWSLNEIIRRHEPLRTAFLLRDGRPVQRIVPAAELPFSTRDLRSSPVDERQAELQRLIEADASTPFAPASPPLMRATLLRVEEREHVLLLSVHHLVFDGWSTQVLIREMAALYRAFAGNRPNPLPPLRWQHADFACLQRERVAGSEMQAGLSYWKARLEGVTPLMLPTDRPRPPAPSFRGALHTFEVPRELAERLRHWTRERGATLFTTMLAAFLVLLHRYTGQSDIAVGTPVAGRTQAETENLIGLFVNTLVLRTDLSGTPPFAELVERVRETVAGALGHDDVPFELVLHAVAPTHDPRQSSLVQVMFSLASDPMEATALPGLELIPIQTNTGTAKFDLTLDLIEEKERIRGRSEYSTDLFDADTIARMADHFLTLLAAVAAEPARPIVELEMLTPAERGCILSAWNDTAAEYNRESTFHELFERQVQRTPDAVAVCCENDSCTYRDLNRRANQLAHYLRTLGVGPEICVGLSAERSASLIVGVLGIMKAGGAYLPLDPSYPRDRLEYMLEHSGASVLVTTSSGFHPSQVNVHCVEIDTIRDTLAREPVENPQAGAGAQNLAYVIYTSGSTGRPKGVLIEHRSAVNLAEALDRDVYRRHFQGPLRASLNAPLSFDVSVQGLSALLFGHTVYLIPEDVRLDANNLLDYIRRNRLHVLDCVPSQLRLLLSCGLFDGSGWIPPLVMPAGEAIDEQTWKALAEADTEGYNAYGPTECAVYSTLSRVREMPVRVSIGRPIANAQAYLLDRYLQPVPPGVPGELYIGGAGVARGYQNRPDITAERFVPDPFSSSGGARLYRTGDMACWMRDGNIEFLGRTDRQVKVRGFRIELGEIEAALRGYAGIREAIVVPSRQRAGETRLVAYAVPETRDLPEAALISALRARVQKALPAYMVPSSFVVIDRFPLTPSGKIDAASLPAPNGARPELEAPYAPPGTREEKLLAGIWAKLLNLDRVGIHDDFFELGGDSILTIQAIARANQAGLRLTPRQLFQNPTVARLAALAGSGSACVAEREPLEGPVPVTPIQHWFFAQRPAEPHHFNQSVFVEIPGRLDPQVLEAALNQVAAHHDALRLRFEHRDGVWKQRYAPSGEAVPLVWEDLSGAGTERRAAVLEERCSEIQASLNLSAGPLWRAAYFDYGDGGRLLLVIHHLAIDAVSWRILLEDLQRAYEALAEGKAAPLPPKTSSYRQWAQALERYAQSQQTRAQLDYWCAASAGAIGVPPDLHGDNTESSSARVEISLDQESFIGEALKSSRTEVQDILAAGLWRAVSQITGSRVVVLGLESHGREQIEETLDISRTVGWFTSIYPARLDADPRQWPAGALASIKAALHAVPDRGVGYGALRYLARSPELAGAPEPQIVLNYLGRVDHGAQAHLGWRASLEGTSAERASRGLRRHAIEISAWIADGRLELRFNYSTALHRRETIENLAATFVGALRDLIRRVGAGPEAQPRPAAPTEEELEAFMVELGGVE